MSLFNTCIKCGEVKDDALIFTADGNYGSTVYDPMSGYPGVPKEYLEVVVCDDCVKALPSGQVTKVIQSIPRPTRQREVWDYLEELKR